MPDSSVALIQAPTELDEKIYSKWETGASLRSLSREFAVPIAQIEQALDRCLPAFDSHNQLRTFKREIQRLEDLGLECFIIAMRDKNPEFMHLYARLNERIAGMRGWQSINVRLDPMAVEAARQPDGYEKIKAALFRLKYGPDWEPPIDDGNGKAADALPPPADTDD